MIKRYSLVLALLALLLIPLAGASAQGVTPTPMPLLDGFFTDSTDPNVNITFPPPVYVVRGNVQVRGSANAPNMSNYFLEFRPINPTMSLEDQDAQPWFPATLPNNTPISEGVLGTWTTEIAGDGLYQLRLTVNIQGEAARSFVVSPLRVENEPPDFVNVSTPTPFATPTSLAVSRPTLRATPTPFDANPTVTALTDVNVRSGDSVLYERIGYLLAGETATLVGRAASGSGWYYIELETGRRGFVAPSIVQVNGNAANLPLINPPATPTPTFTPTPPSTGDLIANGIGFVPENPRCSEPFEVQVNITNIGVRASASGFTVRMRDVHVASNTVNITIDKTVPALTPGQNFVVVFPYTMSAYPGEDHRVEIFVDSLNQIIEENENNNGYSTVYRLRRGTC